MRKLISVILVLCAFILAIQVVAKLFNPDLAFTAFPILPIFFAAALAYWFTLGSKWGGVRCPKCGVEQPTFRKPTSFRQMLWGGYTCANCGTEMDRNGRAIEKRA